MKTTLQFLLFLITCGTFAQITLEHTYDNGVVTRVKLEYSGEKYYALKYSTNELMFYNADHSLWKTIVLPASVPNPFATAKVFHISEAKINPDANLEIIFGYYNATTSTYECKVISEDGTVLLTIPNATGAHLDEIPGLPMKLISENSNPNLISISKVYSVPELALENTYTDGNIKRIKLENSGEKYYLLDKENQNTKVYNQNHSLWKTVSLPKPINASYTNIGVISETRIIPDALLEIGYTYSETVNNYPHYESKIVNENNVVLITLPNAIKLSISNIEGLTNKLMADCTNISGTSHFATSIYDLPSLSLENTYESQVTRVKLENSGEKYYTSSLLLSYQVKIYNSNHTLWKTIDLLPPNNSTFDRYEITINQLSETKINPDVLLELSFMYVPKLLLEPYYNSRIISENGTILVQADGLAGLYLNEIPGLDTKLIGSAYPDLNNNVAFSKVYSLETLGTTSFNKKTNIFIAPNPANSYLNINSLSSPIKEAAIYTMTGALVKKETAQIITKIDVEKLPTGIYIVNLTDFNNQKSTHKITILH